MSAPRACALQILAKFADPDAIKTTPDVTKLTPQTLVVTEKKTWSHRGPRTPDFGSHGREPEVTGAPEPRSPETPDFGGHAKEKLESPDPEPRTLVVTEKKTWSHGGPNPGLCWSRKRKPGVTGARTPDFAGHGKEKLKSREPPELRTLVVTEKKNWSHGGPRTPDFGGHGKEKLESRGAPNPGLWWSRKGKTGVTGPRTPDFGGHGKENLESRGPPEPRTLVVTEKKTERRTLVVTQKKTWSHGGPPKPGKKSLESRGRLNPDFGGHGKEKLEPRTPNFGGHGKENLE